MSENAKKLTLGEKRVKVEFNPSNSEAVHLIKQKAAELVNLINDLETSGQEASRLREFALKDIESGAMWAVKSVYS